MTAAPSAPQPAFAAVPGPTILVADDDRAIRTVLTAALERAGYVVRATGEAAQLWRWVEQGQGALVITDVVMPDGDGLDLVPRIAQARPDLRVLVVSARSTLSTAVRATERGAFDYLPKPFDLDQLLLLVQRALAAGEPATETPGLLPAVEAGEAGLLIGRSPAMQAIYRHLARVVATDLTVMIQGESGTGKELVARALHQLGPRRGRAFVALNMAAIPRELIESELFGHEKGAFTGATGRQIGRFEQAQGGTLFLDEIGDMPPEAQTRLLRVLQEGEFTPIGARAALRTDVRVVAATHRDLRQLIDRGQFREDLFYRLNVVTLRVPPLRERVEDIPALVAHFARAGQERGLLLKRWSEEALQRLQAHRWPGNVRELENLVMRLSVLTPEPRIEAAMVEAELGGGPVGPAVGAVAPRAELAPGLAAAPVATTLGAATSAVTPGRGVGSASREALGHAVDRHLRAYFAAHGDQLPSPGVYDRVIQEVERPLIQLCLEVMRGNQLKAADLLGLNRNTLRKKIRDLDIQIPRGRG